MLWQDEEMNQERGGHGIRVEDAKQKVVQSRTEFENSPPHSRATHLDRSRHRAPEKRIMAAGLGMIGYLVCLNIGKKVHNFVKVWWSIKKKKTQVYRKLIE